MIRASHSSRSLISRGRSMMRCSRRTLGCSVPTRHVPALVRSTRRSPPRTLRLGDRELKGLGRPRRRVSPRAPLRRQPPLSARADSRRAANGSSPVSSRNATGICRRRGTPSFCRSTSQCAFAVRGEMPSTSPTSSFESPCAISSTTCRCRAVMPDGIPECLHGARLRSARRSAPSAEGCIVDLRRRRARAGRRTTPRGRVRSPPRARPRRARRSESAARTRPAGASASSPARPSRS